MMMVGLYFIIAATLAVYREPLINWMDSTAVGGMDIYIALIGLLIAIVPGIPYGVVAAVFGAKYGVLIGTALNIVISVLAAVILFMMVRVSSSEEGRQRLASRRGIAYLAALAERNAFLAIFFARLLPILPAQAINIFAAITRMSWKTYLYATIAGKIPFILLVTLLGDQFFNTPDIQGIMITVGVYGIFLGVVYWIYRHFFQKSQ